MSEPNNELVAPPTEGGGRAADEGVRVGSPVGTRYSSRTPNSPSADQAGGAAATASPALPYTQAEFEALIGSVWSLEDDDPTRFDELLCAALVFIGRLAMSPTAWSRSPEYARVLLRSVEQRALWGPDRPVRQP